MFEQATKMKLRFASPKGQLTVEDVWDLPLYRASKGTFTLDDLAKQLNREVKESEDESFVVKRSSSNEMLTLKFDIVKHIIAVKLEEKDQKEQAATKRQEKQRILEILSRKESEELEGKSKEELEAMLRAL